MSDALTNEYKPKLEKLLPLAKKAYGSRGHSSPAHEASRQYTKLLKEYYEKGGSLVAMAEALGVAYAGLRRRVTTIDTPVLPPRKTSSVSDEETEKAIERVKKAKEVSTDAYHAQIAEEYNKGVSLAKVAAGLGLSSSGPLYYGVNRVHIRGQKETATTR
jgi:predicted nucleic acid-binding protein